MDNLLAKYDADGNLLWSQVMGGDAGRVEGRKIAADEQGVYLTGSFQHTADFDLTGVHPGDMDVLNSQGQRDAFVVRYQAADGAFDWIQTRGGSAGDDEGIGVSLSGTSVYVSGLARVSDGEAFVWKMRATDGADDEATGAGWYRQTQSDTTDGQSFTPGMDVAVDNSGNVWVAGAFAGGVDFDPHDPSTESALTTLQGRRNNSADGFVWKLSADDGDHLWVGGIGGRAFDRANAIATDVDGNVYVTGRIEGAADVDPGTGKKEAFSIGQKDSERSYVLKLDNDGGFVGATDMGNVDTHGWDIALTAGSNPDVFAVGGFASEGNFGDLTLTSAGFRDGYLVRLSQALPQALHAASESTHLRASAKPDRPGGGGGNGGGGPDDGPSYTIMALGSLGGDSNALDINDSGQVVGSTGLPGDDVSVPYVINPVVDPATGELTWFQDDNGDGNNDLMTSLQTVGAFSGFAKAINGSGQVVGRFVDTSSDLHGFLVNPLDTNEDGAPDTWYQDADNDDRNDLMIDLGAVSPRAINSSGQIVGIRWDETNNRDAAFVIDPQDVDGDGVLDWFDDAGDGSNSLLIDLKLEWANDINDNGQVVGRDISLGGFVITPEASDPDGDSRWVRDSDGDGLNDLAVVLPDAIGGADSTGWAISNTNVIAGSADSGDDSYNQAAQWQFDSSANLVVDILGLLKKSDNWSAARDVNDDGVVIGHSQGVRGGNNLKWEQPREPLVTVNGEMKSLESLVTDMGDFEDLDEVWGINNAGYIVGTDADDDWFTNPRAFIAIPSGPTNNLATARSSVGAENQSLTIADVGPLHHEALRRLQNAGIETTALQDVLIVVTDLPGTTLGIASGNTIYLDSNAAGWGWFVDPTPADDSEFTTPGNQGEQNRIDLLSVLVHEMGHILGYGHADNGWMEDTLAVGVRSLLEVDHVDALESTFEKIEDSVLSTKSVDAYFAAKSVKVDRL